MKAFISIIFGLLSVSEVSLASQATCASSYCRLSQDRAYSQGRVYTIALNGAVILTWQNGNYNCWASPREADQKACVAGYATNFASAKSKLQELQAKGVCQVIDDDTTAP